jgi:hypothetical protein
MRKSVRHIKNHNNRAAKGEFGAGAGVIFCAVTLIFDF